MKVSFSLYVSLTISFCKVFNTLPCLKKYHRKSTKAVLHPELNFIKEYSINAKQKFNSIVVELCKLNKGDC